ncbi:MAG: hypothetical protein ACK4VO_10825 [Pseudobdellovibrio sp.]
MITIRKQYIYNSVGNSNLFVFLFLIFLTVSVSAEQRINIFPPSVNYSVKNKQVSWNVYKLQYDKSIESDRIDGISYMISGGLALVGGLVGSGVTKDPLEKGIYAVFQTIGIASIGYGAYKHQIGDEQRLILTSLMNSTELTDEQKVIFYQNYLNEKKSLERNERFIKAVTHGLIAALNFYNASQQSQDGVKNTLVFIGGANMLASVSYSF